MDYPRPNIFISKCLEHGHCRYDGSQITSPEIIRMMPYVNYIFACPEMAIGLPSPRQAIRLIINDKHEERLVYSMTGEDVTEAMRAYSIAKAAELAEMELDGFILKSRSPTCGIKEVKLYKTHGKTQSISNKSKGLFAETIIEKFPLLAIEDEGRISNFNIREHFLTNVFSKAKFREVTRNGAMKDLVKFQSDNKYLFMAYNQTQLKQMGSLVANHEKRKFSDLIKDYEYHLSLLLKTVPQQKRNVNVIMHILGYFSKQLSAKEKAYFLDLLEQYGKQQVPVSALTSVLKLWAIRFETEYLLSQTIFEPYPISLITVSDSGKGRI